MCDSSDLINTHSARTSSYLFQGRLSSLIKSSLLPKLSCGIHCLQIMWILFIPDNWKCNKAEGRGPLKFYKTYCPCYIQSSERDREWGEGREHGKYEKNATGWYLKKLPCCPGKHQDLHKMTKSQMLWVNLHYNKILILHTPEISMHISPCCFQHIGDDSRAERGGKWDPAVKCRVTALRLGAEASGSFLHLV